MGAEQGAEQLFEAPQTLINKGVLGVDRNSNLVVASSEFPVKSRFYGVFYVFKRG